MLPLERLLQLVRRTGLPTILSSAEGEESFVLLPLSLYERLSGEGAVSPGLPSESIDEIPPTPLVPPELTKSSFSLQDLLQAQEVPESPVATSVFSYETEALEDRFAFEGADTRILPVIKQKSLLDEQSLDEFGPTLA